MNYGLNDSSYESDHKNNDQSNNNDTFLLNNISKNPKLNYHNANNITSFLMEQSESDQQNGMNNRNGCKNISNNNITHNNSMSGSINLNESSKQILPHPIKLPTQVTKRRKGFQIDMTQVNLNVQNDEFGDKNQVSSFSNSPVKKESTIYEDENSKFIHYIKIIINHIATSITLFVVTVLAFFISDLKILVVNSKAIDLLLQIFNAIVLIIYVAEFVSLCIVRDNYCLSLIFYLDLMSIISLVGKINGFLRMVSGFFYNNDGIDDMQNVQQMKIFFFSAKILQILKTTMYIKIYRFIMMVFRRWEINKKLKDLHKLIQIREERNKKNLIEKEKEKKVNCSVNSGGIKPGRFNHLSSSKVNNTFTNSFLPNNQTTSRINGSVSMTENKSSHKGSNGAKLPSQLRFSKVLEYTSSLSSIPSFYQPQTNREGKSEAHEAALIELTKNNLFKEKKKIELENESQISKIVAVTIIKQLFLLVFLLLILFVVANSDNIFGIENPNSLGYLGELINHHYTIYGRITPHFKEGLVALMDDHHKGWSEYILNIQYNNTNLYSNQKLINKLNRKDEICYVSTGKFIVIFSLKYYFKITAWFNIIRNLYLGSILIALSFWVINDTKQNIVTPLDVMYNTVNVVAKDPVNFQSIEKLNNSMTKYMKHKKMKISKSNSETYIGDEIKTIQLAIIRISSLMAIGFGEAGGQILKENMNSFEGLNPMIPGKKINGIFGFCLIRNFQQINEALQEKTIVFVNEIASIVHTNVNKFGGVCNKNIGESFLLIWKLRNKPSKVSSNKINTSLSGFSPNKSGIHNLSCYMSKNDSSPSVSLIHPCNSSTLKADCALLSFLNVIKKINKSPIIKKYQNEPLLQGISKNKKFKLKMGFGLHVGWGIEGAIGSFYKIDCSYLSPNVNIAARLETATNIYGVDILLSGELYSMLSNSLQSKCRLIDCVTLKGSNNPVKLYTVDINRKIPQGKTKKDSGYKLSYKEKRINDQNKRKNLFDEFKKSGLSIDRIYLSRSKGLRNLLKSPKTNLFLECFNKGYYYYIQGQWEIAHTLLKEALYIDWTDGPTNSLLKFIENNNNKAPDDWKGYRALNAKF